jgi:hypothetical protein
MHQAIPQSEGAQRYHGKPVITIAIPSECTLYLKPELSSFHCTNSGRGGNNQEKIANTKGAINVPDNRNIKARN